MDLSDNALQELFTLRFLLAALGVTVVMLCAGRVKINRGQQINETKVWDRFGSVFVLAAGVGLALIPGVAPPEMELGLRVVWGGVAGLASTYVRDLFKPWFLRGLEAKLPAANAQPGPSQPPLPPMTPEGPGSSSPTDEKAA